MAMVRVEQADLDRVTSANARLTLAKKESSKEIQALTSAGARGGRALGAVLEAGAIGALLGAISDERGYVLRVVPADVVAGGVGLLQIGLGIGLDSELATDTGTGVLAGAVYSAAKNAASKGKFLSVPKASVDGFLASPEFGALPAPVQALFREKLAKLGGAA